MKRWAMLTVAVYLLSLALVVLPMLAAIMPSAIGWACLSLAYTLPVLLLVQAALLLIPVAVESQRPVKRRNIVIAAVAGAVPMGVLALCVVFSLIMAVFGDKDTVGKAIFLVPLAFWIGWSVVFHKSYSAANPHSFTQTVTRWLLRGSVLELLVAVPCHIITRQRGDCCAPMLTLLALAIGLSVALMSFGPGVFLLFAKRMKDKRRAAAEVRTANNQQ